MCNRVKPKYIIGVMLPSYSIIISESNKLTVIFQADIPYCKALYDFNGQDDKELSFREGDVITIVGKLNDEWLEGKLNDQTGMFPIQFVNIIKDIEDNSKSTGKRKRITYLILYHRVMQLRYAIICICYYD